MFQTLMKVLLEHIVKLEGAMGTTPFCIQCSQQGHTITECTQASSSDQMVVVDVIGNWKKRIMQEGDQSQESQTKKKRTSPPTASKKKVSDEFLREEMLQPKVMVWYVDDAQPMDVAADRIEGGPRKYNARELAEVGPYNIRHLYDIVEQAFRFTKSLYRAKEVRRFLPTPADAKIPRIQGSRPKDYTVPLAWWSWCQSTEPRLLTHSTTRALQYKTA